MLTNELLQQLETCAQIIMAPSSNILLDDRTKAEKFFLDFQETKSPFELCQKILETSQNQFVLFQVGACLKSAVIREWPVLGVEKGQALFNYLFEYINQRPVDLYVIEELMLVSAVIVKRIAIENKNDLDKTMINALVDLIKNTSSLISMRINACISLLQILSEYCTINYNSDYGLSWYSHLMAKRNFEKSSLKDIFKATIEILFEHLKLPEETRRTNEWIKLSSKLIRICEVVLCWNFNFVLETFPFISAKYAHSRDRIESLVFQPPSDWLDFIIEGTLVSFFFELYLKVRPIDPNLLHSALQCLTQLSTMTGPLFYLQRPTRKKFTETFMINTISLCNIIMDVISIHEVVFLSNLFNSVCVHLRSNSVLQYCDFSLAKNFFEIMAKLTCKVMLESAKTKVESADEENFEKCNQSIDYLLNSMMMVINLIRYIRQLNQEMPSSNFNMSAFISVEELVTWSRPIFETYLRIHLNEPEGLIPPSCLLKDNEDIQEFEESDAELFKDQLIAIGCIAQVDAAYSVNTVMQLLILKLQQYEACIRNDGDLETKRLKWVCLSEDIHWILMISTHVFTSYPENEIPSDIIKVSIDACANIQATQTALQLGDFNQSNIDPVCRFFIILFKFVQMEKQMLESNMSQFVSPQVSHTLAYFISRFMHVYLVPAEFDNDRGQMSLALNTCFGADSINSKQLVNYFLDHLETKFLTLSSEIKVLELSSEGLRTFCKFRDRIKLLQECGSLSRLLQKFPTETNYSKLSSTVRRNMYNVFIVVFNNNHDSVIEPLMVLYQSFCTHLQSGHIEQIQEQFLMIADFTLGIASGLTMTTFSNVWKKFLLPFYNDLPQVLKVMHRCSVVVQAILELLFKFSVSFCCFFEEEQNLAFYDTAVNILIEYANHTKNTFSMDPARVEEIQAEFLWILEFLNDLAAQDIFFFFTTPSITSSLSMTIGKVVLTSLNIIMPLMNDQLLENEKLCLLYYKLLEFISQDSERFKGFPIKLFESYLKCVEYAFKAENISNEIKTIGFKILFELGLQTATSPEPSEEILNFLQPFFQVIIEFIFRELVKNSDLVLRDAVAMAFYTLICCFKEKFKDIILRLMSFIGNSEAQQQICQSLFQLVEQTGFDCQHNVSRLTFKKKFSEFMNSLRMMLSLR